MGRIRAIKPGFFTDAELYDAELESGLPLRVAFAGLWTVADREGRFAWKPREIKTHILPYDNLDMETVLTALARHGFIFKYKCAGYEYGFIPKFAEHQHVNKNEAASTLPEPPKNSNARARRVNARAEIEDNNNARELTEINPVLLVVGKGTGTGKEGNGTEEEPPLVAAQPRRKPRFAIPADFPGESQRLFALKFWADHGRLDLAHGYPDQRDQFRDHHAKEPTLSADWPATWRTWVRNAPKFSKGNGNGAGHERAQKPSTTANHLAGIGLLVSERRARNVATGSEDEGEQG